jgi:hypothetical protein
VVRAFWGTVVGKLAVVALAIVVAGTVVGILVNRQSADDKKGPSVQIVGPVSVEVDVFSGRNNPRFALNETAATELSGLLSGLDQSVITPRAVDLGYRGFVVTFVDGGGAQRSLRAFDGAVASDTPSSVGAPGGTDTDRALERWLFDQSEGQVDAAVRDAVLTDLGRPES